MDIRELREEETERWAAFCSENFEVPADYFLRHFYNDPWADIHGVFTAWENGELCGSVRVLTRELYLHGERVRVGGIGEVCTAKSARGKGVSTALLKKAVAYMERRALPISLLFTGTQHHYAHLGWFTVPRRYVYWDVGNTPLSEGVLSEAPTIETLSRLYDRLAPRVNGVLVRNEAYWRSWVANENWYTAIWERDGKAVAYAVYRREENQPITVSDCLGETAEDQAALLDALCSKYTLQRRIYMPAACAPLNTDYTESYATMARLNAPFTLGGKRIETTAQLAEKMASLTFFSVDSY